MILLLKLAESGPSLLMVPLQWTLDAALCVVGLFIELQVVLPGGLSVDVGIRVLTCLSSEIIYSIA